MKIVLNLSLVVIIVLLFASCRSYKNVPYFMDSDTFSLAESKENPLYDAKIMPKDLLTITVSSIDPEAASPFNLNSSSKSSSSQNAVQTYLVDNEGDVNFPVLGKIHLGGMTKVQAENLIVDRLKESFKETPIVTIRMVDYKISVLGEVTNPNTFTINNEKINILEALAMAGDMTIYGKRDAVKLIRESANGKKEFIVLNLNKSDIVNSPYYYLQQNDVIYVEPNKAKAKNADIGPTLSIVISGVSLLVTIANLIITLVR